MNAIYFELIMVKRVDYYFIDTQLTYIDAGDVSGDLNGIGDTHISSNGIFPTLSIKPGVEVLLGSAAKNKWKMQYMFIEKN